VALGKNIGKYLLERKVKHVNRKKTVHNLDSARSIGILFKINHDPKKMETVMAFINKLSSKKRKVIGLCYFEKKNIPPYYLHLNGLNVFSKNDLTWYYTPKRQYIKDFINNSFDVLIDLSLEDSFEIDYIARLSKASFKIGRFSANNDISDLMINIQNPNINVLTKEVYHFLEHINN
jgi:hypothetical protein